jgi:hypothetical protein
MDRAFVILVVLGVVAGCSTGRLSRVAVTPLPTGASGPPFSTGARFTKQQLDWYVQRAIAWMQTDRDFTPDGGYVLRPGFLYGNVIDSSRHIECVQSDDGAVVTVTIPQRIDARSEYWVVVHLDAHTGAVMTHGARVVSKSV